MPDPEERLSIGAVARRTGLSVHTLRYYEREGLLLGPVRRAPNGHRVYAPHDVEWLVVCTTLRATGMPLDAIRRYAELIRRGEGNADERLALLRAHERDIGEQVASLMARLGAIGDKVRRYAAHVADGTAEHVCDPVLNRGLPPERPVGPVT